MAQPTSKSSGPSSDIDMAAFGLPSSFSAMPKTSSSSKRPRGSDSNASSSSNGQVEGQVPLHPTASVSQGGRGGRGGHRGGMSRGESAASHGHRGRGRGRGGGGGRGGHGHATNGSDRSAEGYFRPSFLEDPWIRLS